MRKPSEFIDLLNDVEWFCNVGQIEDESVIPVKSWEEASIQIADEIKWLNFKITMERRQHELWVAEKCDDSDEFWQVHAACLKVSKSRKVKALEKFILSEKRTRPEASFGYHILTELWMAGREYLTQDFIQPYFFLPVLFDWYRRGHYPCGWSGRLTASWYPTSPTKLPNGKLIVY